MEELLEGSRYKDDFKGGIWIHQFLNTTDYHRQHASAAPILWLCSSVSPMCSVTAMPGIRYNMGTRIAQPFPVGE